VGSPDLNVAPNYHFIANILVGSVTYQHDFGGGSDNDYAALPADNTSISNRNEDLRRVRQRYVF
jgi:hypothetical protein